MYAGRRNINRDDIEAVKWYPMAAKQGDDTAQSAVGDLDAKGTSVAQIGGQAYAWFNVTGVQGVLKTAKDARDAPASRMTREELARGRELTGRCWEAYATPFRH